TSSANIIEVPVDYEESDVDSLYEITDNELLSEASVDSNEFNIEVLTNSVLGKMSSDFKEFDIRSVIVDETDKDSLKLKVDIIFSHENLPSIRSTDNHYICGNGKELWLNEEETNLVNPTNVEQRINVWLCDMPKPSEYEFYIKEIVYHFN
ncbi:10446_t:CDS:2, partial [Cetraspora pellucida]